jgi:hypothetical protein
MLASCEAVAVAVGPLWADALVETDVPTGSWRGQVSHLPHAPFERPYRR